MADERIRSDRTASRVAIVAGIVFVLGGLPKFVAFNWELDAFVRFGLPVPEAWVIVAGVVEIGGGALLIARRQVVGAALLLAITMAVAVAVSGVEEGDVLPSLTLAPALLAACLYLLVRASPRRPVPVGR
ncbi:MAG: DoxX family protein [Solirubrobacteraceae bacterium]